MYVDLPNSTLKEYMRRLMTFSAVDVGRGPSFRALRDPRVTPVGRLLRAASLDELPQFLNVLWGDMSLVGPRPPIPYETRFYDEWHWLRLSCKPGLTGVWQVKGSATSTFDEMVKIDLEYIKQASISLDLWTLIETPMSLLRGDGAY